MSRTVPNQRPDVRPTDRPHTRRDNPTPKVGDSHLSVAVDDTKTGRSFELVVGEGEQARDVFQHPYAYEAGRRAPATPSGPAADVAVGVRAAM